MTRRSIGWTACPGAEDWMECDAIIAGLEQDADESTPMWDAFWSTRP